MFLPSLRDYWFCFFKNKALTVTLKSSGIKTGMIITIITIAVSTLVVLICFIMVVLAFWKYPPIEWSVKVRETGVI